MESLRLDLFLPPMLIAFSFSAVIMLFFILIPFFQRSRWREDDRHKTKTLSRLGGLALLLSFVVTALLDPNLVITREFIGLFVGAGLILFFGLWDDMKEVGWKIQIFFQVTLAFIVFLFGVRIVSITNPLGGIFLFPEQGITLLFGFFILLFWILLVMNAMNWLDGVDGVCGGVSIITLATIFFLSLKPEVNQPPIALLCVIGIGAILGFLFFNFYPARILAGTVGALFLGFLIAVLAVIAGTKIATAFLVLSLPIADALWVIGERFRDNVSIFQGDQRHLHYKLLRLGWKESSVAWFFFVVTALIALLALSTEALGKFVALVLIFGLIFSLLALVGYSVKRKERGV